MPFDNSGKFQLNNQRMMAANKMPKPIAKVSGPPDNDGNHEQEPVNPGAEDEEVKAHLSSMHGKTGGKHMHIHSHAMSHKTHHVTEDGEVHGPDEHDDDEALGEHVKSVMGDGGGDSEDGEADGSGGFGDLSGV